MYSDLKMYIDGQWLDGHGRKGEDVINPATGKVLALLPHASKADLDTALGAAQKGFQVWKNTSAYERSKIMRKAADLLRERVEHVATAQTMEQGKSFAESRMEVLTSADIIDWYAEEGRRSYGRIVPGRAKGVRQIVLQEPVGVVAAFTPWNFPTLTPVRKIAGALAAGCSIIIKASEETPAGCVELVKCFADAGVPAGVLNLVFGVPAQISEHLVASDIVRKISFTGSIPVGKHLAGLAAKGMKRATMELGGHAPVIVCDDADVALAVKASGGAKFRNAGQVCISPTRFLVHNSLKEEFAKLMVKHAESLKLGDGLTEGTTLGPLANARRLTAMAKVLDDARKSGATVATGGERVGFDGNFFAPTVLTNVSLDSDVFNNEPFGPIAAIRGFDKLEEAISEANRLPYGLAGYAFTQSIKNAHLLSQQMEVGMLWINQPAAPSPEMPFGGVKDSGYGSEGGPEAMEAYLVTKAVSIMSV
jgi:succinate-semialdehyde dehydrogenase/glutarate-semialdehyde dehydrogenase